MESGLSAMAAPEQRHDRAHTHKPSKDGSLTSLSPISNRNLLIEQFIQLTVNNTTDDVLVTPWWLAAV